MTDSTRFLTSAQAAARLGVKPATLYAYVSRGLLVRHKAADGRTSLFDPAEITRLQNRSRARHSSPTDVVVASELTLVAGDAGRLWYRGLDPLDACRTHRFEEVAGWLWSGRGDAVRSWRADPASLRAARRAQSGLPKATPMSVRLTTIATAVAARHDTGTRPRGAEAAAADLMSCLVDALPGGDATPGAGVPVAGRLWPKLTDAAPSTELVKLLDASLSLTADHGLTYSSLVARITASGGASVAASVAAAMGAGLASVRSTRFGSIEQAIAAAASDGTMRAIDALDAVAIAAACSTEPYGSGDPRASVLLELLDDAAPDAAAASRALADELGRRGAGPPTASFAQAAVAVACGMRQHSGETISLVSRAAGWIAHALEEHRRPTPYRPRLAYTGPPPSASTPRRMLDAVTGYLSRS